VFDNSCVV